jgi:TonB family protein
LVAILVAICWIALPRITNACDSKRRSFTIAFDNSFDDSPSGLRHLAQDALKAVNSNDESKLLEITRTLVLPNPEQWFSTVFGDRAGRELGQQYSRVAEQVPGALAQNFKLVYQQKLTSVEVEWFTDSCKESLDEHIYPVLLARKTNEPLSWLQFGYGHNAKTLRYFAYVDGAFRFVGKLDPLPFLDERPTETDKPSRIIRDSKFIGARRIDHVVPLYPPDARVQHIQGTVKMHVIISTDGSVQSVQVLSGECLLADAAVRAVRQFKYSPSTINGTPIEIDSTIDVVFTIGG